MASDRAGHLRRKYGLTEEIYDKILKGQEGCCAICKKHESSFEVKLAVDHNHRTGEVRGLLCRYCNHRLVGRHTDPELLLAVSEYLRKTTGLFVPKKRRRRTPRKVREADKGKTARPKVTRARHRMVSD